MGVMVMKKVQQWFQAKSSTSISCHLCCDWYFLLYPNIPWHLLTSADIICVQVWDALPLPLPKQFVPPPGGSTELPCGCRESGRSLWSTLHHISPISPHHTTSLQLLYITPHLHYYNASAEGFGLWPRLFTLCLPFRAISIVISRTSHKKMIKKIQWSKKKSEDFQKISNHPKIQNNCNKVKIRYLAHKKSS